MCVHLLGQISAHEDAWPLPEPVLSPFLFGRISPRILRDSIGVRIMDNERRALVVDLFDAVQPAPVGVPAALNGGLLRHHHVKLPGTGAYNQEA